RRRFDAVEGQAGLVVAQAKGCVRAQHVHVMAAKGEHLAQLRRDDAAASDGGVTDDADVHGVFNRVGRWIGSRTTTPSAHVTPASAPNCASRLSMSCRNTGVF